MTCSVRKPLLHRATEIAGTWDFKWPLGTEIRVAFQKPPNLNAEDKFDEARREVIRLARRWEDALSKELASNSAHGVTSGEFFRNGIRLAFPEDLIFDAPGPYESIAAEEHRSPFLREDARRRHYDVLVSLENLPLNRRRPLVVPARGERPLRAESDLGVERVATPTSDLGCYARRRDFGVPTIFLGRFGKRGHEWRLHDYFKCPIVQHVVVHEFGHVLGLAHEHQNPHFPRRVYREAAEIRKTFTGIFQVEEEHVSDEDIREQLTDGWPGAPEFSDWDDLRGSKRTLYDVDSIMAYPFHHLFLRPELRPSASRWQRDIFAEIPRIGEVMKRHLQPPADGSTPDGNATIDGLLTQPTRTDVSNLVRMYAPCGCYKKDRKSAVQQ